MTFNLSPQRNKYLEEEVGRYTPLCVRSHGRGPENLCDIGFRVLAEDDGSVFDGKLDYKRCGDRVAERPIVEN